MGHRLLFTSMYLRRLALLACVITLPAVALTIQLANLTLVQGGEYRNKAEKNLVRRQWLPSVRGRILDRNGLILAQDRPSFDVSIDYRVMTGAWAERQAAKHARITHKDQWAQLSPDQRERLIVNALPRYEQLVDQSYQRIIDITGVDRQTLDMNLAKVNERIDRMVRSIRGTRRVREFQALLARGQEISTGLDPAERRRIDQRVDQNIREQEMPHVVLRNISDDAGFELLRLSEQFVDLWPELDESKPVSMMPGLTVLNAGDRAYPMDSMQITLDASTRPGPLASNQPVTIQVQGVAAQLLGSMRHEPQKQDHDRRAAALLADSALAQRVVIQTDKSQIDRGRYHPDDAIGASGVEADREDQLRGLRGLRIEQRDTGKVTSVSPTPGQDVQLTIDIKLQATIQAILDPRYDMAVVHEWHNQKNPTMPIGAPINGAAVVLQIDTGDILAMVSSPSFDRQMLTDDPGSIFQDTLNKPWINRAISVPYQPGSIVKAPILVAAVTQSRYDLSEHIVCTGHYFPNILDAFRCWIFKDYQITHSQQLGHDLSAAQAIMVSCNIFFYTMGDRLGPAGIVKAYQTFGVGKKWNLGAGDEFSGWLGPRGNPDAIERSDAIFMGMGQGPVAWTPLHAANAYATLARQGIWITPRLIMNTSSLPEARDLNLDQSAITQALQGLWQVVNDTEFGSGNAIRFPDSSRQRIFNAPGVSVWGKTGTAEASPTIGDPDGDGPLPKTTRTGDHSWFLVLVGPENDRPLYAIAVIMEYAGSGGRVSGPIANQIIHTLKKLGYL